MATVVKSKSNICNNRAAAPIGESAYFPGDVVVLCESATFPGLPEEGHVVMMNNQNGCIYVYSDNAILGKEDPVYIGRLPAPGMRIISAEVEPMHPYAKEPTAGRATRSKR